MHTVQWSKHAWLPSFYIHSQLLFQVYLCGFPKKNLFKDFLDYFHKMLQTLKCRAFSNSAILIASINNLAICKHAHCTCAFLDGAQFDNTAFIYILYKMIAICTDVIHDVEEQCVTHLIPMMKKPIFVDWMFCKIILHNLITANFALSSYIWAATWERSPMLFSCLLLQIWYLQHQNTKHNIKCSFIF